VHRYIVHCMYSIYTAIYSIYTAYIPQYIVHNIYSIYTSRFGRLRRRARLLRTAAGADDAWNTYKVLELMVMLATNKLVFVDRSLALSRCAQVTNCSYCKMHTKVTACQLTKDNLSHLMSQL
jgi:alkylhydroperoxidase family enzyme